MKVLVAVFHLKSFLVEARKLVVTDDKSVVPPGINIKRTKYNSVHRPNSPLLFTPKFVFSRSINLAKAAGVRFNFEEIGIPLIVA